MATIEIAGWVGSPRKGMHTDIIVSKALEGAEKTGATVKKIYLNDLQIKPCQACAAPPTDAPCIYRDGMDEIYDLLEKVDGIIIGTPAYYGSISSQLKLVIDRVNCLQEMTRHPDSRCSFRTKVKKRKQGLFFWIADASRDPTPALVETRAAFGDMNIEMIEVLIVTDSEKGEGARNRSEILQKAFDLGRLLVNSITQGVK